ncbi:gamma-glutamylcyclotransferase [Alteromonas sp. a30]|uniref:gamma-glutamylcyclotransferase n=1 Tax=Alteromonas sp. a30 TaxID=2730917 RepID=UPI00227E51BC|nr:gamma-glutamylcyclotransferase [Alteromonas sp. a30]MCY7295692.1 gamma-glutamylcyclotransferase [Alteromonas sp. a30]
MSEQHYVLGYGSLMSHDSRYRYSNIDAKGTPVLLSGWQRGWVVNCPIEKFTSVGATENEHAQLNALLVPVDEITPELQSREKNYRFSPVDPSQVIPFNESDEVPQSQAKFWVCEVLNPSQPCENHPIYQSYLDTCIAGCLESANENFASLFITSTFGWLNAHKQDEEKQQAHWVNDRDTPFYPRAASINEEIAERIDDLLAQLDVLPYRQEK